jgi:hypothetical protein
MHGIHQAEQLGIVISEVAQGEDDADALTLGERDGLTGQN